MTKLCCIFFLSLSLLSPVLAVENNTIPQPVLDWYTDLFTILNALTKDLDSAKDAKGVTRAYLSATTALDQKQISIRRNQIEVQFDGFFSSINNVDKNKEQNSDLLKVGQDFSVVMLKYSNALASLSKFLSDPHVAKSINEFTAMLTIIEGSTSK